MRYPFGPDLPTEFEQLERDRRARELLEQLMPNGNALPANVGLLPANAARPWLRALPDTTGGSWSGAALAQPLPYRPLTPPIDPRRRPAARR